MPYGVSNSFRRYHLRLSPGYVLFWVGLEAEYRFKLICSSRGILKTYSRQGNRVTAAPAAAAADEEFGDDHLLPRKRVRMDETGLVVEEEVFASGSSRDGVVVPSDEVLASSSTVPSSPPPRSESVLFSDDVPRNSGTVTPLSSPPPEFMPSSRPARRKPAFSFLKRKRSSRGDPSSDPPSKPLAEVTHNVVRTRRMASKLQLTQMQIDLGGEVRRSCKTCGMEFIPSVKEDNVLHEKFCAIGLQGVDISKALFKDKGIRRLQLTKESRSRKDIVVIVDRRSSGGARKQAKRVLEIVNTELSASEISDEQLWGALKPAPASLKHRNMKKRKTKVEEPDIQGDRFKIFMYLVDAKCAGFCLAEKISAANRVVEPETGEGHQKHITPVFKSSSISISAEADVALVGISRIWTSSMYRRKGIASMLLECVRGNFFYGMEVPRDLVAFSQPSESGGRLAEHWFEAITGWHVYSEDLS